MYVAAIDFGTLDVATLALPLSIGGLFGAALYLSGLADPDKIIGTLRLKDFHAMRTIAVFVLVGMAGTWVLGLTGQANLDVKPLTLLTVLAGGALLGLGFGMTGYCPGTGLACAAAGRFDALITVVGMFGGALVYLLIYPYVVPAMEGVADYGKARMPETFGVDAQWLVLGIVGVGTLLLWITKPRKKAADELAA